MPMTTTPATRYEKTDIGPATLYRGDSLALLAAGVPLARPGPGCQCRLRWPPPTHPGPTPGFWFASGRRIFTVRPAGGA
jgi:hypothetical protein